MNHRVTFFTVCGGGEEYDFLLGGIEHHARIGNHLVFDVSPKPQRFFGLPPSVRWEATLDPEHYHSGDWRHFRLASALEHARALALSTFPETHFLVHLDCDEYYDAEIMIPLLVRNERAPIELPRLFTFPTIHWLDGRALRFGPSEMHMRAWDVRADAQVRLNKFWRESPRYNGNPEHHPYFAAGGSHQPVAVSMPVHYHLHYALGRKQQRTETAETTIVGWPNGTPVENPCPWPDPLQRWVEKGELPSKPFLS